MRKMIRKLAAPIVLAAAMSCAGMHAFAQQDDNNDEVVSQGYELLKANCARCHAITMDDSSKHEEAPPFRVVVTRYPPEDLAESLAEGIISGHPDMPEFVFQPPEIEAILAYLGTLQQPPVEVPEKKN